LASGSSTANLPGAYIGGTPRDCKHKPTAAAGTSRGDPRGLGRAPPAL